jgi:ribonuclease HII
VSLKDFEDLGYHCGVDEVGRGAWSGPVVAAAVRFNKRHTINGLADSKALRPEMRIKLYFEILDTFPVGVSFFSSKSVDKHNILNCSLLAMEEAVHKVFDRKDNLYFDGNTLPKAFRSSETAYCVTKGDTIIASIAAASIVAKVSRDFYMKALNIRFPGYGWGKNVGYGVEQHKMGINRLGLNTEHRRSFSPIYNILCL